MKFVKSKTKGSSAEQAPAAPRAPKGKKTKKTANGGGDKKARGKQKFVLLVGDEGAILVYMQGATVVRRLFAASPQPDHTSAVLELLNNNPKVPLYILADVIDQQYVRHSFPPVSALSVNNLVKRRIERDFQAEDITGFVRLGRDKTGRKEWQYLLIALAYTPLMQQWLDLIVEQPNELKGIFLAPVEGQAYIPMLHDAMTDAKPLPWQLMVSHHKVSGFRQIVLRGGKLVFTRVTQAIDDAMPAVIAGNIETEIMNTLEYLKRLGFLENNAMEIMVVASQEVQEAIDLRRFNAGQSWALTPLDVAEHLGLEQAALSADRFGDVVMAAGFTRAKKHQLKLFTAYAQKLAQIYAARLGIKILGALLVVALLGMSAMNVLDAVSANSAASQSEDQRRPVQQQLESVRKAIDGLNKDVAFKSAVMLTYDAYLKDAPSPDDFINELAPHLVAETRIRKIVWGVPGAMENAAPSQGGAAAPAAGAGPLEIALEMDIIGQFSDTEELAKFVTNYVTKLKTDMPNYDITNAPYPWQNQQQTNLEISFDQQAQSPTIKEGDNKITLIFNGPKANAGGAAPGATAPAGMMP